MEFKFTAEHSGDVSFNLVAPLHSLELITKNSKKLPKDLSDADISAEGFISYNNKDSKNKDFSILVRKKDGFENKNIHFTIIASTEGTAIRLETGITHYETLPVNSKGKSQYIFEYNQKEDYVVNFYSHNAKNK